MPPSKQLRRKCGSFKEEYSGKLVWHMEYEYSGNVRLWTLLMKRWLWVHRMIKELNCPVIFGTRTVTGFCAFWTIPSHETIVCGYYLLAGILVREGYLLEQDKKPLCLWCFLLLINCFVVYTIGKIGITSDILYACLVINGSFKATIKAF